MRNRYWAGIGASIILGLILIVSGLGKLPNQAEFLATILSKSFLPPLLAHLVSRWLPAIEVALGSLLIIAHNSWVIYQGLGYEPCGCLGILDRFLQGKFSTINALYMDIGMLALVLIILLCYPGKFFAIHPWFLRRGKIAE